MEFYYQHIILVLGIILMVLVYATVKNDIKE
jgi:hypothetical protein